MGAPRRVAVVAAAAAAAAGSHVEESNRCVS